VLASARRVHLARPAALPDYLICGLAPADGLLSKRAAGSVLLDGIRRGMHIINGLHEFPQRRCRVRGGSRDRRARHPSTDVSPT